MTSPTAESGRARLRSVGREVPFRRGDLLLSAGAPSTDVLLVESGLTKVVLHAHDDDATTVVGLVGPGELLGESGVITRAPRSATIVALTQVRAVRVAATAFLRLRADDAGVRELLDQTWRLRHERSDLRQVLVTRPVRARVELALLAWARRFGTATDRGLVLRGLSQQDLAMAVAASEQHVAAALAGLREDRLVETGRLRFRLPDPGRLGAASPGNQGESHRPAVQDLRNRGRQPRGPGS